MKDIIYINEKTEQIVPETYPEAIRYVRVDTDGIIKDGEFFKLVKDDGSIGCIVCAMKSRCAKIIDSACLSALIYGYKKNNYHFKKGE